MKSPVDFVQGMTSNPRRSRYSRPRVSESKAQRAARGLDVLADPGSMLAIIMSDPNASPEYKRAAQRALGKRKR